MVVKMKNKTLLFGLIMVLTMGFTTVVAAEEADKTVVLTQEDKIEYTDDQTGISNAFQGMAPGDTKTVTIRVQNDNSHTASFFISQETLSYLEEKETASGGAYSYDLKVGTESGSAVSLLDTVAGGYDSSLAADDQGINNITELEDYQYFAELGTGEYTNVYLTLTIDGEGFDSTDQVNYENAVGELEFNFRAYYKDRDPIIITETITEKEPDTIIEKVVDQVVKVAQEVKTGDSIVKLVVFGGVLVIGVIIVVIALKKRKAESK